MNGINRVGVDLSIIIPSYNAKARAMHSVEVLGLALQNQSFTSEILLVDDGSRAEERPDRLELPSEVRLVQVDQNRGKGHAVRSGMTAARGRVRIFTDVDLPYGIDAILECYAILNSGVDFVYGDRSLPDSKLLTPRRKRRRVSSIVFRGAVFTIAGLQQADTQCGIKGLRAEAALAMLPLLRTDGFAFDVEIFRCAIDNGLKCQGIPVHLKDANDADSTVRLVRDSTAMLRDLMAIRMRSLKGEYRLPQPMGALAV